MVLTITSAVMGKNSSIEGSDSDSLSEKFRRQHKELHHVAFEVGSVEEVFAVRERLREQGATITFEGRRRAGCQIAVEFLDPDGHCLEIYWGLDQIGTSGYVRPASEWKGIKTLEAAVANPVIGQEIRRQK
jgi:catechol 2,3-dioxygenase